MSLLTWPHIHNAKEILIILLIQLLLTSLITIILMILQFVKERQLSRLLLPSNQEHLFLRWTVMIGSSHINTFLL